MFVFIILNRGMKLKIGPPYIQIKGIETIFIIRLYNDIDTLYIINEEDTIPSF